MKLTDRHRAVIRRLIDGWPVEKIAEIASVTKATLYKWQSDPDFKAALEIERDMIAHRFRELAAGAAPDDDWGEVRRELKDTRLQCVREVKGLLQSSDEKERRQAALQLMRWDGFDPAKREPDIVLSMTDKHAKAIAEGLNDYQQMRKVEALKERDERIKQRAVAANKPERDTDTNAA